MRLLSHRDSTKKDKERTYEPRIFEGRVDEQTGAPTFGYPAKDQRKLAAECRRLKSMLET
jgi:hypothetical protein